MKFCSGGNAAMDWHLIQVGVEILMVASCYIESGDLPLPSHSALQLEYRKKGEVCIRARPELIPVSVT